MRTLYRVAADRSKGPCRGLPRTWPDVDNDSAHGVERYAVAERR